jgi:hypothetical protein
LSNTERNDWSDPEWDKYTTPTQQRYLEAVRQHGGLRSAARALGTHPGTICHALRRLERARGRIDPTIHARSAPNGHMLRGVSTLLDAEGNVKQTWVKTKVDHDAQLEFMREAMQSLAEPMRGRLDPLLAPAVTNDDTLAVYPWADTHMGMLAWGKEAGVDFDLKIAERMLADTTDRLIASAPRSEQALFIDLGDYFHTDNHQNRTERAGNVLDVDSRYAKMAHVGLRVKRRFIDLLLHRHQAVEVWTISGNHDENSAVMLAIALEAIYEREPRLQVSVNPSRFQVRRFGANLIGGAHGHTANLKQLPGLMAAQWPDLWGQTQHRIWYTGHVHHDSVQEYPGCLVETLRTVAPRDAWSAGKGYSSGRDLKCDVWHRTEGRIARIVQRVVDPDPKA